MFDLFLLPFMQRAMLAGVILAALLSVLGVFMVLRRMSFFGEGIAHASLAGVAIGIVAGVSPLVIAIIFSVLLAALIFIFERKTKIASDAIIGILFTASMAAGILILHFVPGFKPELMSFLFGNILAIQDFDLLLIALFAALILFFFIFQFRRISLLIFDRESAYLSRIPVSFYELLLYMSWAVAVVLGVKMLGIILVSALLIIPTSIARLVARSFESLVWGSVIAGEFIVISGLILSVLLNVPSGAMIILFGFVLLVLVAIIHSLALAKK